MGAVLAASFDRAVTLLFKTRRLVLLLWCLALVVSFLGMFGGFLVGVVGFVWFFFATAIAVRTVLPKFKMTNSLAGTLWWASIVISLPSIGVFALIAVLAPGAVALLRGAPGATVVLDGAVLTAGMFAILALETRIGFAPILTQVENVGTIPAVYRSWELTRGKFWATLFFVAILLIGTFALETLPSLGLAALFKSPFLARLAVPALVVSSLSSSLVFPLAAYANLAQSVAFVYYLRYLGAAPQHNESALPA